VTPLFQTYASYPGMLGNEFFLDYGYDVAVLVGTLHTDDENLSVEVVNLTTGAVSMARDIAPADPYNQQVSYIGNDTVLVLSQNWSSPQSIHCQGDCPATVEGVNVRTGQTWPAASLGFFEANNVYWLPQKRQFLNVEAHGASGDEVQQWNETDDSAGQPTFSLASSVKFDQALTVDWVNGMAYNATTQRIAFSAGGNGVIRTYVLGYSSNGLLTAAREAKYDRMLNIQRYAYTSPYVMGPFQNGIQYLIDPWNGSVESTNEPFTSLPGLGVCDGSCYLGTTAASLGWVIDFHATVARNDPFWSVVLALAV